MSNRHNPAARVSLRRAPRPVVLVVAAALLAGAAAGAATGVVRSAADASHAQTAKGVGVAVQTSFVTRGSSWALGYRTTAARGSSWS